MLPNPVVHTIGGMSGRIQPEKGQTVIHLVSTASLDFLSVAARGEGAGSSTVPIGCKI